MENTILLDIDLCVGCGACIVACMDQNDTDLERGEQPYRRIYKTEEGRFPAVAIRYLSAACLHCEDSPCIIGCPTCAITKDPQTGAVTVQRELCIGCHSCALACPFGVPRYDSEDKMQKCGLCNTRIKAGLEPACVRVCPMRALQFKPVNQAMGEKESKYVRHIFRAAR